MGYRPITDVWFLARAKLKGGKKYYGAYLGGFPERARALLGASINEPVLHVCGGMARHYPYAGGFGEQDMTVDIDPATKPDYVHDVRNGMPFKNFKAYLCDPPYSEEDAKNYNCGSDLYPKPNKLVKDCIDALPVGGRVGIIHYILPACPKNAKFIACVAVYCGFNNRGRTYSVFERTE